MSKSTVARASTSRTCWSATSSPCRGRRCARRPLLYAVDRRVPLRLPPAVPADLDGPDGAPSAEGISVRLWDFLFYASFGFVVTSSVAIAGVLLVFCYLIVPSVAAMLYAEHIGTRLAIGWTMGTVVSLLGICLSLKFDLPTGATIVCTFGGGAAADGGGAAALQASRDGLTDYEPRAVGREPDPAALVQGTARILVTWSNSIRNASWPQADAISA